jgi:hypothetical protein
METIGIYLSKNVATETYVLPTVHCMENLVFRIEYTGEIKIISYISRMNLHKFEKFRRNFCEISSTNL